MAHPMNEMREHKMQHSRVAHLTRGYAHGGAVRHDDEAEDKKLIRAEIKRTMETGPEGRKNGGRLDRYARGGKVGKTTVNVIVAPKGDAASTPTPVPVPAAAPPMPPRPPMPVAPPVAPPAGMIRNTGGRAYAKGGAVKSGPAWDEGRRNGTQVSHSPGKNDIDKIDTKPPLLTRRKGGKVEAGKGMGPHMTAGADSGEGRLEKIGAQKRR